MIICMTGGIGNQMFQYAFGLSYVRKHKENLCLDIFYIGRDKRRKLEIDKYNISYKKKSWLRGFIYWGGRKLLQTDDSRRKWWDKKTHTVVEHVPFGYQNIDIPEAYVVGDWINLQYFQECRICLLNEYRYKGKVGERQKCIIKNIRNEDSLAVHVRRGDYLKPQNSLYNVVEKKYYEKAISYLKNNVDISHIYFFSDDIEWCRSEFKDVENTIFVDSNLSENELIDLEMMRNCKYFIIANSTFSWWGAWLSEREGKIMIAPEKWFDESRCDDLNKRIVTNILSDFVIMGN